MLQELLAIFALLAVVAVLIARLPKVDLGHSPAFIRRRFMNWFPLGLTYAFLYMGRYNLTVSKNAFGDLMTKEDFGTIFFWGTLTYGVAFIINGPLADRIGGRATILLAAAGSALMNLAMGAVTYFQYTQNLVVVFSVLYAANMYFQSFGAVSIVKVNASWFHLRERGVFGGIFGILISLGVYFAYDWGRIIVNNLETHWVFFIPTAILLAFFAIDFFLVRDRPSEAGFEEIDTGDATEDDGVQLTVFQVAKRMMSNPVILTIALIEFCSGFLRNAIMQWGYIFGTEAGLKDTLVFGHWGAWLCIAGITGGMFAGVISDRIFGSRRGPVAAVLYGGMVLGCLVMFALLDTPFIGWLVVAMSLCIIGVHGMLSGTASMDFGGKKNAGMAVGIIDGFVYLGTAAQAVLLGRLLPSGEAQADPSNWTAWPLAMLPVAVVGLLLAARIWNARPAPRVRKPESEEAQAA